MTYKILSLDILLWNVINEIVFEINIFTTDLSNTGFMSYLDNYINTLVLPILLYGTVKFEVLGIRERNHLTTQAFCIIVGYS